ncbi:MAG: hypothetical protein QHJ73_10270, partial [Armatimonadota bacterium]|nr:hypothetical protein [Armatimonadota bacterium]
MKLERLGLVLALLMAAAALGLEIDQRLKSKPPGPSSAAPAAPAVPETSETLQPMPVVPEGHEFGAKDGKLPRMQGFANGRKQYEFTMDRLIQSPGGRQVTGEGARGVLLGPTGEATVRFSA